MKLLITVITALFFNLNIMAQSNFYKLSIGAGSGFTHSFTDVAKHNLDLACYGVLDYHFTPFVSIGGELQKGQIAGGVVMGNSSNKQFINSYASATLNAKLALGAFLLHGRNSIPKNLYIGLGAGLIHNKMKSIAKDQVSYANDFLIKEFSNDIILPLNLGLNVYFKNNSGIPVIALNINVQSNVTFGDGLDGYVNALERNSNPDIYNYYSVGIKYHIGLIGITKRTLF
jgi:hypothetical protein